MTCEVLIREGQSGFIATVLGLPGCSAQATTRAEAIEKVRLQAQDWLSESEVVRVEIDVPQAAKRGVGIFADEDEESWNGFLAAMKEYRQQVDADPNEP